jgi:hypothetical protein
MMNPRRDRDATAARATHIAFFLQMDREQPRPFSLSRSGWRSSVFDLMFGSGRSEGMQITARSYVCETRAAGAVDSVV